MHTLYPQRLKPSIKNAPDCVPSLLDLIIPWQWLTVSLPKPFRVFLLARERKTRKTAVLCEWFYPSKIKHLLNAVKKKMCDLSHKIGTTLQPVFTSWKLEQDLKPREIKPPIVNQQCVVYSFTCDLCDSDYVGFTARHLHQHIVEHKYSAIGKHFSTAHGDTSLLKESQFCILKTCQGKFDFLVYEMLFIKKQNPSLNTQTDSIRAKLFALSLFFIIYSLTW